MNRMEFRRKMLNDTLIEQYERKRIKYLRRKYFSLWLENSVQAKQERFILNDLQMTYHFLNNERLLEFLTGIQLIIEHNLTSEQTQNVLKYRRYLKRNHIKMINSMLNLYFDELLQEELYSIVIESNHELDLRQKLYENALQRQSIEKRKHYLQLKYFSLWLSKFRQRKDNIKQQLPFNNNNKRLNKFFQLTNNKKFKENIEQYHAIKNSFDQLTADINQIQLFINELNR